MERFDVRRGVIKEVSGEGGLSALARRYFEQVESTGENSFSGSHGIMTSINGSYEGSALMIDVTPLL